MKKFIFVLFLVIATYVAQAQVTFSITGNLCTGTNLELVPQVAISYDVLSWNVDGQHIGQQTNPSPFFCSFGYGEHNIILYVIVDEDTVGQKDSVIFINAHPDLTANINGYEFCEGAPVTISVSSSTPCTFTIGEYEGSEVTFPALPGTTEYLVVAQSEFGCTTEVTLFVNAFPIPINSSLLYQDGEIIVEETSSGAAYRLWLNGEVVSTKYGDGGVLIFTDIEEGIYSVDAYYTIDCIISLGEVMTGIPSVVSDKQDTMRIITLSGVVVYEGTPIDLRNESLPAVFIVQQGKTSKMVVRQ